MKYVSLFSGIEAATVAWEPLGWEPMCFAEFDEFPSAVLAERYPEVPNVGDVTKMNWKKYRNKVDLVVGGSPCQSFSIAGKGALVSYTSSLTSATGNTQTLFSEEEEGGDMIVRRLTPKECERLQGFPTQVRLKAEEMTSDELIACALANGDITCDLANGKVYGTRGPGGKPLAEKRELGFIHPSGYVHINLSSNGVKKQVRAHRVIYMAANGHIPDDMVVDHINNDKSDNRICNLQLLTAKENSKKAADDGLYLSGEDNPRSKITAEIRSRIAHDHCALGMTYRELAQKYGVSKSRIGQIINECDRTKIPYRGKPAEECPDGPRYKAIGNSMAVPVMRWIGERIAMAEAGDIS